MSSRGLTRWRLPGPAVFTIDLLTVILLLAAVVIAYADGIKGSIAGVTFTARDAGRPVIAAFVLLVIRRLLARDSGPFASPPGTMRRLTARWFQRHADAVPAGIQAPVRSAIAATIGYCAVAGLLLHTQIRQMDAVPDLGDPLFSMWRMGWLYLQLLGDPRALFDGNTFHPERLTLTFSDAMLLTSLPGMPLLASGIPLAVTYNVLLILFGMVLSGVTMYLLVARLTGSPQAAFVAGLLYGFHPFRFEHYSHLELQMTYWMPLALLALHRFADSQRPRDALLAALCAVLQLYTAIQYGVFFPFYATVVFGTLVLVLRPPLLRLIAPLAAAAILAIAMAIPLSRPYVAAQDVKGERHIAEVTRYSATPADYVRAHSRSALYGGRLQPDIHPERALFPGVMPIALAIVALFPVVGGVRLAYLAGLIVAFELSLGMNGVIYPHLYEWLTPIRGMRVPARFSIILGISLAVLAGFGVRRLLALCRTARTCTAVFALVAAAVVLDVRPILTLQRVWLEPPSIYASIAGRDDVVLAEFPFEIDGIADSLPQMYFSTWHGRQMVNGYSGFFPPSYQPLLDRLETFPEPRALAALREHGVTHVTVTCALMRDDCQDFLHRLDASSSFREVVSDTWEGQPVRLYEFLREAENP